MSISKIIDTTTKYLEASGLKGIRSTQDYAIAKIGPFEVLYSMNDDCIVSWGNETLGFAEKEDVPIFILRKYAELRALDLVEFQDAIETLPIREGHIHNYFLFDTVVEHIRSLYDFKDEEYTRLHLAFDIARFKKHTPIRYRRFNSKDIFVPKSLLDFTGNYAGYLDVFIPQARGRSPENIEVTVENVFLLLFMNYVDDMKLLMEMVENMPIPVRDEIVKTGLLDYEELFGERINNGKYKTVLHAFSVQETAEMAGVLQQSFKYVQEYSRAYMEREEKESQKKLERKKAFKAAKETLEKRKEKEKKNPRKSNVPKTKMEIFEERIAGSKVLSNLDKIQDKNVLKSIQPVYVKKYYWLSDEDFEMLRKRIR